MARRKKKLGRYKHKKCPYPRSDKRYMHWYYINVIKKKGKK